MKRDYTGKYNSEPEDEGEDEQTIIDLSRYSISESCCWLLHSLNCIAFSHLAYTIPFCSYVMSWHRAVPLRAILILQSPYPRNIFPQIAAAMSYDTNLCKKMMEGREMPPTIQVLVNDLYINGGMEKEDSIAILKNGWALVDKGILLVNEAVFHTYNREESYIEAAKQCSVLIRLLQETEKHGKRTIDIYAFGEVGEKVGSNLCSWYKSSIITLTKRKVTHPAGVARRFTNLDDPDCHMNTPSFSKSLVKCLRNHVAFMHTMSKNSEKDIKYRQQQDTLDAVYRQFSTLAPSLSDLKEVQKQIMDRENAGEEHKALIKKLDTVIDDLITRFRITSSIANNMQARTGTVSNSISKSAPSMKGQAPSESLLSQHVGQDSSPAVPIASSPVNVKPIKVKRTIKPVTTPSTPADASSFADITAPPSVASVNTNASVATQSSQIKVKPIKNRTATPIKDKSAVTVTPSKSSSIMPSSTQSVTDSMTNSVVDLKDETEDTDKLSPLANRFKPKMKVPQPKAKSTVISKPTVSAKVPAKVPATDFDPNSVALSKEVIHALTCVAAVVSANKSELTEEDTENFDTIQEDIKAKTVYNGIVERLVSSIKEDISNIPDFNFVNWSMDASPHSATFDTCKEEFEF